MSVELDGFLQETRQRLSQVLAGEAFARDDKESFEKALKLATKVCKISPNAIASAFRVTEATVNRWVTGEACPGRFIRGSVIEWLVHNLQEPIETVPAA